MSTKKKSSKKPASRPSPAQIVEAASNVAGAERAYEIEIEKVATACAIREAAENRLYASRKTLARLISQLK